MTGRRARIFRNRRPVARAAMPARERNPDPSLVKKVQCRALAEPLQLRSAEGVIEAERFAGPVRMLDAALNGIAGRHPRQPDKAHPIVSADAVVIAGVLESQRQKTLLFQIGFVDTRE